MHIFLEECSCYGKVQIISSADRAAALRHVRVEVCSGVCLGADIFDCPCLSIRKHLFRKPREEFLGGIEQSKH